MPVTSRFVLLAVLILGAAPAAQAANVNVSQRWCGGGCSEGHNDTECICTYNGTMSQSDPAAWVGCRDVQCCDSATAYCDLGYVNVDQCPPREQGGYGEAYERLYCSTQTQWGEKTCEVPCGASGCYIHFMAPHFELVNTEGPNLCTRSNETADWWNPWTWTTPCTLWEQTPWDDPGDGLICG